MQPHAPSVDLDSVTLEPAPIPDAHVIAGRPDARNAILFRSADGLQTTFLWHCTAGTFRWFYEQDETLVLLSGGMTLHFDDGTTRICHTGDAVAFPAGTSCVWEIDDHARKLASLRRPVPWPVALPIRVVYRLLQASGLRRLSWRWRRRDRAA
jgi:uncharacterized protein